MKTISPEIVTQLLTQRENPILEFKRDMYRISDKSLPGYDRQRDELIKDVLALANNNTTYSGDQAHLIIGVTDESAGEVKKELVDAGADFVDAETILSCINSACRPPIGSIAANVVEIRLYRK